MRMKSRSNKCFLFRHAIEIDNHECRNEGMEIVDAVEIEHIKALRVV